jgi:hypothetical protein
MNIVTSDRLAPTAAALAKENEARRATIRTLLVQIATIRENRDAMFDDLVRSVCDYPNRGWDQSYRHMIEQHEIRIEQLVWEIASVEPGNGFYQRKEVTGAEFRAAYRREIAAATE